MKGGCAPVDQKLCVECTVAIPSAPFKDIDMPAAEVSDHPLASILIVEDDPQQIRLYTRALNEYRLTCVRSGTAALAEIAASPPDVVLLDHILAEGEKGTDFLPRLKQISAHVPIIIISGTLDIKGKLKALQGPHHAHYVIEKPVSIRELRSTIEVAITECGMAETIHSLQSLERAERIQALGMERRFTKRLSRQHHLLMRLRKTLDRPNISELAREYGVGRKTIIRDLHDLIHRGQLDPKVYPEWKSGSAQSDDAAENLG
jgi:DNA-binding NtrC family response regulator